MSNAMDPGCEAALAQALGHAAPFSADELAGLSSVTVQHAKALSALSGCTGLRHLRIVASEFEDLMPLEPMAELEHLEVMACHLQSFLGPPNEAKLKRIDLLYTSLTDASDVLGILSWRRGTLVGNPWSETSYGALRNELRRSNMFAELSSEDDWEQSRLLWERSEASCGYLANAHGFAIKPGLPTLTPGPFDAIAVETGIVARALRGADFSLAKLFADYAHRVQALSADELSALAQSRSLHSATETRARVEVAKLPEQDRAALLRFLDRFPEVSFYGLSAAEVARKEQAFRIQLPSWYRELAQLVDGWLPRPAPAAVRFDRFEEYSPRQDSAASLTYMLGLRGAGDDTDPVLRKAGFQIVGLTQEHPQSTLAIRLRDDDPQVYEYSEEDLLDVLSESRDPEVTIRPIFSSYAAMLGHIVSIHPRGDDPITAA
jgi:hypothetical protein